MFKTLRSKTQILAVALMGLMASGQAFAQEKAGDVARGLFDQVKDFADLGTAGAMLIGIFMGILALLKFKAYNENPQQTKISTPIILTLVAAGLIGLPAYLNMSRATILEGEGNSMNSGVYDSIGG